MPGTTRLDYGDKWVMSPVTISYALNLRWDVTKWRYVKSYRSWRYRMKLPILLNFYSEIALQNITLFWIFSDCYVNSILFTFHSNSTLFFEGLRGCFQIWQRLVYSKRETVLNHKRDLWWRPYDYTHMAWTLFDVF